MIHELSRTDLVSLVRGVFHPRDDDRALALLVDLPDRAVKDHPAWAARRALAASWWHHLREAREALELDTVDLVLYRNVRRNNADFPPRGHVQGDAALPSTVEELVGSGKPFAELFERYTILIALTQFSATAPLKLAAPHHGFRAATMPGFGPSMIPALKLNWEEIDARCRALKALLDTATAAHLRFAAAGAEYALRLDLRHRTATASGGLVREPGTAGNVPSGETYIVPYEGEREGDPSHSAGDLPLELDGELLVLRIEDNRVVEVRGDGPVAARERRDLAAEPAYANVAELGLGVLAAYGIRPVGEILLDEKLGLHIAFGRSDHFGGSVGADDFTAPERVVHIDRVYIPEVQPGVRVVAVDLEDASGIHPLMRDGDYV